MRDGGVRQELANFLMGYADSLRDADAAVEDGGVPSEETENFVLHRSIP